MYKVLHIVRKRNAVYIINARANVLKGSKIMQLDDQDQILSERTSLNMFTFCVFYMCISKGRHLVILFFYLVSLVLRRYRKLIFKIR